MKKMYSYSQHTQNTPILTILTVKAENAGGARVTTETQAPTPINRFPTATNLKVPPPASLGLFFCVADSAAIGGVGPLAPTDTLDFTKGAGRREAVESMVRVFHSLP